MLRRVDCARDWLNVRSRIEIFEIRLESWRIQFDRADRSSELQFRIERAGRNCPGNEVASGPADSSRWPDNKQTNRELASARDLATRHTCSCLILNRKLSVARKESTKCRRQSSGCSLAKQELPRAFFRSLLFNLFLLLSLNRLEILGRVHVLDSRILLTAETKKFVWTKF